MSTQADPKRIETLIAGAQKRLDDGRIAALTDYLTQIGPRQTVPQHLRKTYDFLFYAAALYGQGDAEAARRQNADDKKADWAGMRYRLALRQKEFATAAKIRRLPGVTQKDDWDFRCTMGLHLIWRYRYKWGFHFYQDRWHAKNFSRILPSKLRYQPVEDIREEPEAILLEQGVGEQLLSLMHMRSLRLEPKIIFGLHKSRALVNRVFPRSRFVSVNDVPNDQEGRPVVCAMDIVGKVFQSTGSFAPKESLTSPTRDRGRPPIYGICWRGGSGQNRREERHIPLHLFLDLLPRDARFVPLQFDVTRSEAEILRADQRCQPPLFDVKANPGQTMELVRSLAVVISVDSANWHFAQAAQVPFLAIMNPTSHWLWGPDARAEWAYSCATTIPKSALSCDAVADWMAGVSDSYAKRPVAARVNAPVSHRPVLMPGLPRSGTSMTMDILARHGIWIGNTMQANAANPNGFFENLTLKQRLVKRLLRDLGADENGVNPLPDVDNLPLLPGLGDRIIAMLAEDGYDKSAPWAFKDPKLTLIWPVLASAFPDAVWIIPKRDREAVVRSLSRVHFMKAHSIDPEYWRMFCAAYDQRLTRLMHSGANVHIVDTDALVQGGVAELSKVIRSVGLSPDPAIFDAVIDHDLFGKTGGS